MRLKISRLGPHVIRLNFAFWNFSLYSGLDLRHGNFIHFSLICLDRRTLGCHDFSTLSSHQDNIQSMGEEDFTFTFLATPG